VHLLFYTRLIGFTAGTLVYLFLLALILGHRRPRLFERLLFFLNLALFLIYAGGLLAINATIQYGSVPPATKRLCEILLGVSALLLWPLIVHTHVEYSRAVQQARIKAPKQVCVWLAYAMVFGVMTYVALVSYRAGSGLGAGLLRFVDMNLFSNLALCTATAAVFQFDLLRHERSRIFKSLEKWLGGTSFFLFAILIFHVVHTTASPFLSDLAVTAVVVAGILPGAVLIYYTLRHNFLDFGAQRNLVYALSATFLALLYLALVRRVSVWLEGVLPPEATASILLFVLIFLFEPLERVIGPALHRAHKERFGRMQKLTVELQEQARHGELEPLLAYSERRIREELGLAALRISIPRDAQVKPLEAPGGLGHSVQVPLMQDGSEIGLLEAASTGSYLTGETTAALEFLAEQLPAMVDLCRLIEEKLRLERELAERERLALLGQMAASVSHNLRNPLSSMKTVLQVQLENPNLPVDVRRDCALVVTEIDRMNSKLTQLLHFAKPSVNGQRVGAIALAKQTTVLFRHDAERRNVRLEFEQPREEISVLASDDALSEVLSNLIVNAIEAQPNGGRVRVALGQQAERLEIVVEDDGPGISQDLRSRIFQPFFTTKASGTGLGLSIVARRVAEMGGTIACESPLKNEKGTRFRLTLPLAERGATT
jgi:signal transduction histidine kinase